MTMNKVWAVYFTGTGTTKKIVLEIAKRAGEKLGAPVTEYDFSLPEARRHFPDFKANELVIFGTPVYAGRVPNLLLKQLALLKSEGSPAVPVVLCGNRDYDDALMELRDILFDHVFKPFAAGAFVGEHSFSTVLGKGRPDASDLTKARSFADNAADRLQKASDLPLIQVKGTPKPYRGYYQPRDHLGNPIDIRKVKPDTNDKCVDCKLCAAICPMGAIDHDNVRNITGICIKCCACVKRCPKGAKFFSDKNYLYHQHELEAQYTRRAEPDLFI
jgi:ferredoxin/flavodoxin